MFVAVIAPQFTTGSAGIFALHQLGQYIAKLGHTVAMVTPGGPTVDASGINGTPDLVFVPEIYNRPINCKNVVRWCLNIPGKLKNQWGSHGPTKYENELVLNWPTLSEAARAATSGPVMEFWLGTIDPAIFHQGDPKTIDNCHWIGKATDFGSKFARMVPPGSVELTRWMPRPQYSEILRKAKKMWSFDAMTSCTAEAYVCGCDVMMMREPGVWSPYSEAEIDRVMLFIIDPAAELARTARMLMWCEENLGK